MQEPTTLSYGSYDWSSTKYATRMSTRTWSIDFCGLKVSMSRTLQPLHFKRYQYMNRIISLRRLFLRANVSKAKSTEYSSARSLWHSCRTLQICRLKRTVDFRSENKNVGCWMLNVVLPRNLVGCIRRTSYPTFWRWESFIFAWRMVQLKLCTWCMIMM